MYPALKRTFKRVGVLPGFLLSLLLFSTALPSAAGPIVIDFEGLTDSTILSNQYSGVTFSNAIILTAGISLNEFEFPPQSGVNVASDSSGPMSISFSSPIMSFGAYFTHIVPLTLRAFDAANTEVALIASLFSDNLALSGDTGSHPNEFLQLAFAAGISRVSMTGDPAGGSFSVDDATIDAGGAAVPEPGPLPMVMGGWFALLIIRVRPGRKSWVTRPLSMVCPVLAVALVNGTLFAAPNIGATVAAPAVVIINTPTEVVITTAIDDPSLIPTSVNLLRLDNGGAVISTWVFHDDGLNGDLIAGDKVFSVRTTVNEPAPARIHFQVSAAFRGLLYRVRLDVQGVFVQPANAVDQAVVSLAGNLMSGNITAALNGVIQTDKNKRALTSLDSQGRLQLATFLTNGRLVRAVGDLRIYQAPWVEADGTTTQVEFSLIPDASGQWVIMSW